jgi:hypothetical protein
MSDFRYPVPNMSTPARGGKMSLTVMVVMTVISGIIGLLLILLLVPILVLSINFYIRDVLMARYRHPAKYREFEKLRKQSNKLAVIEKRRQTIAIHALRRYVDNTGKSEELFFEYRALVCVGAVSGSFVWDFSDNYSSYRRYTSQQGSIDPIQDF